MTKEKKARISGDLIWALLAYLSVLLFIPLLKKKKSSFVSYHVNQGLVLLVLEFCCCAALFLLGFILKFAAPAVFFVLQAVLGLFLLIFLFCHVVGILHVCFGQKRSVPIFGEIKLYKPESQQEEQVSAKAENAEDTAKTEE